MPSTTSHILEGISIRPGEGSDLGFINVKVQRDLEKFWPYRSSFDDKLVFKNFNKLFQRIIKQSQVVVAARGSVIVGFVAFDIDKPLVYFAHILKDYRQLGLCRAMLHPLERPFTYAIDSHYAKTVASKLGGIFDPFAFCNLKED